MTPKYKLEDILDKYCWITKDDHKHEEAISAIKELFRGMVPDYDDKEYGAWERGWNDCRSSMIKKIEEL